MVNVKELDLRLADHAARVARANEYGWMREESGPTGGSPGPGIWAGISSMRQRVGLVMVRTGERLRGTPAGHNVDPTAAV